jgi:hypothetical protein
MSDLPIISGENHQLAASQWQTLSHIIATKIEWKLWKWHSYFETIYYLKHMLLTS